MGTADNQDICFVIMPISDPEGYENGHFLKIYEQVFKPAIIEAGYLPQRVDEDKSTGVIHAKIIKSIIDAPMVLCDLSARNPNVLFELGIRQAFNKPVVLVQEYGTNRIFDVSLISAIDYRKDRIYDEVIEDQGKITTALKETKSNPSYNSLISVLKIGEAKLDTKSITKEEKTQMMLSSIMNEIGNLKYNINDLNYAIDNRNISRKVGSKRINTDDDYESKLNLLSKKVIMIRELLNKNNEITGDILIKIMSDIDNYRNQTINDINTCIVKNEDYEKYESIMRMLDECAFICDRKIKIDVSSQKNN
jgi:hypothetical protein